MWGEVPALMQTRPTPPPLHSTNLLSMNLAEAQEPKLVTKLPKLNSVKPLKRRPARFSMFHPDRLPEYTPKEWPLDIVRKEPKPKNTTLIQHVFEYTP